MKKDKKIASIETSKDLVRIKAEDGELRPTVDAATMRRLPLIDFDSIIDNSESSRRQQVIFDLLQNNLPDSADDIYYIYHDENTNTFSVEVDETSEEIQNFIGSIMLIDARLKSSVKWSVLTHLKSKPRGQNFQAQISCSVL